MMRKGQLSIDLITTVLVAVLFLQTMIALGESVRESNAVTAALIQERSIANDVASFLTTSKVLDVENAFFTATYRVDRIITGVSPGEQDCAIAYSDSGGEQFTVTTDVILGTGSEEVMHTEDIAIPENEGISPLFLSNLGCNRLLVVTNES